MNSMKKGFTLIEIMVVIVILGILSAVVLPKLFGHTAKAKASEIKTAYASYMKLQDFHIGAHQKVGNWKSIGYSMPQSTYFRYDEGDFATGDAEVEASKIDEGGKIVWRATSLVPMGSCEAGSQLTLRVSKGSSRLEYILGVSSPECLALMGGQGVASSNDSQVAQNTEAQETEKKKSVLTGDLSQKTVTEDNKYSLAKAIYSNRDSRNMEGWGVNDGLEEAGKNMKDAYGIEGYVLNSNALNNATVKSLLDATGTSYSKAKVVTELSDVAGDAALTAGVHQGTQTLYYGSESGSGSNKTTTLSAYGSREVFVKVGESGNIAGYCSTADCNSVKSEEEMLSDNSWYREGDPFNDVTEEQYNSAFASLQTINCEASCMKNIIRKQNSWDSLGFDYYSKYGFENSIANISHGNSLRSMMMENNSNVKETDSIRAITQVFNVGADATPGTVYAGVSALYYGTENGLTLYDTRKVYAKMTGEYSQKDKKYDVWVFYSNMECTKKIGQANVNNLSFWSKKQ